MRDSNLDDIKSDFEIDNIIFKKTNDEEEINLEQVLDFSTVKRIESLMAKAMPVMKFAKNQGELDDFVNEVNRTFSPLDMTVNQHLESICDDSLPDVAEKIDTYLHHFNEFIVALTDLIDYYKDLEIDINIDIKVYRGNKYNLIFFKKGEPILFITKYA